MNVSEILSRLSGVTKSARGWQALCPAHQDRSPSLNVSEGKEGRVLLKCYAGCELEKICAALGLQVADLFNGKPQRGGKRRIVARYPYSDESGALLFEVVRFEPKDFRQRRPDPAAKDGWTWDIKGVRRPLFHLPQLIAAVKARRPVYVPEGEKDVLVLEAAGFPATCNPGGAGKWRREYSLYFQGATVIVIADKDEAGRKHAANVAAALQSTAASVKVIECPDLDGKPVKDAADFFAAGGQASDLDAWAEAASPWTRCRPDDARYKPGSAGAEYVPTCAEKAGEPDSVSAAPAWPEPKPLPADLPSVPPFNFDCLPDTLRPWIQDVSDRMQCPPDFPAVGLLVALGSLVGRKIGIRPKCYDIWLVISNLWGCVVGRPGVMKTPALEQALLPLRRLTDEALEKYEAEKRSYDASAMIQSQRKKLAERKISASLQKGDENAALAAAESAVSGDGGQPVLRRYEVNDSTVAKLGELLAENPNGLLLHRDELVGFLNSLDKEGNQDARAFFLEAWNGTGSFTFDRIGRGTVRVKSNTLSLLGGIQPDLLTGYVREAVRGGVGADGLLQRFQLAVWPDTPKQWRNVDRWPDTDATDRAFAVFKYLAELTPEAVRADTSGGVAFLRFAPDAQERFYDWRAKLETRLRDDTEHPAFEAHLSKYRKLVPALALLIHLANRDTGPVSLAALDKALLWATYLEAHARRIYSAVLRPDTAAARELAKRLQRGELGQSFTLREVYRKGWAGLAGKEDAEAATEILSDLGWIRQVPEPPRATPGRAPSAAFEVSPKISAPPTRQTDKTDTINSVGSVSASPPGDENLPVQCQSTPQRDTDEEGTEA